MSFRIKSSHHLVSPNNQVKDSDNYTSDESSSPSVERSEVESSVEGKDSLGSSKNSLRSNDGRVGKTGLVIRTTQTSQSDFY